MAASGPRRFGQYLARLRADVGLNQADVHGRVYDVEPDDLNSTDVPDDVRDNGQFSEWLAKSISQTAIARLETGRLEPRPFVLQALAKIYGVPPENILTAYIAFRYFDSELSKSSAFSHLSHGGALFRPFFVSNVSRIYGLPEIFDWERELVERSVDKENLTLWIISRDFVDHHSQDFLNMVVDDLLLKGCDLTYFVREDELKAGEAFDIFLAKAAKRINESASASADAASIGKINAYGLTVTEETWLTSSMVIANPDDIINAKDEPEGYVIVSVPDAGGIPEPAFGLQMSKKQLRSEIPRLRQRFLERRESFEQTGETLLRLDALSPLIEEIDT